MDHDEMRDEPQSVADSLATRPSRTLLIFRSGEAWLAVDAWLATEVVMVEGLTPLPRMPEHVPGLIFMRGHAVPLLDPAVFLDLGSVEGEDEEEVSERVVVVASEGMRVGLLCRRVRGVCDFVPAQFETPDALGVRVREFAESQVLDTVGLVAVLDVPALLRTAKPAVA